MLGCKNPKWFNTYIKLAFELYIINKILIIYILL